MAIWSASTVLGELGLGGATLGGVVALGQPITVSVDALLVTASLPTATPTLGASVPAAAVLSTASIPVPTIEIGTHVQADAFATTATAPAASAQGGARVSVAALSTTAAVPAATLACAATVAVTPARTTALVPRANGVGIVPGGMVPTPQPGEQVKGASVQFNTRSTGPSTGGSWNSSRAKSRRPGNSTASLWWPARDTPAWPCPLPLRRTWQTPGSRWSRGRTAQGNFVY